jgi:hypothetical protein
MSRKERTYPVTSIISDYGQLSRVPVGLNLAQSSQCSNLRPRSWFLLTGEKETDTVHHVQDNKGIHHPRLKLKQGNTTLLYNFELHPM